MHHVGGVAGDRQTVCGSGVMHEQRQSSRVSAQSSEGIAGAEGLAGHDSGCSPTQGPTQGPTCVPRAGRVQVFI